MSKTILVIDDETITVEITKRKLEEYGYTVLTAKNGEEALTLLSQKVPDLVVLDIQMPKMNGYTFMIEKCRHRETENIPVIVLTAHNEMEPVFKRHGIKAYLLKPLKLQELLDTVMEVTGPST